jgi:periplasmic divalent cation tolerance protein
MSDVVVVLTTVADDEDAETLARQLVEQRLAACVNLLPAMISLYHWKGRIEKDGERQMLIKTTKHMLGALQARLKELHRYELPEFLVLSAEASVDYLAWVNREVEPRP